MENKQDRKSTGGANTMKPRPGGVVGVTGRCMYSDPGPFEVAEK